ncbi:hypothetical protein MRB53_039455 [Persea americana]|nr:hypothetical protein MRB53_039455 [Persea americana]
MTSSPKPISPGQAPDQHRLSVPESSSGGNNIGRNRSVSLNTQLAHSHVSPVNHDSHGRTPPLSTTPFPSSSQQNNTLPPLNASNPNLTRPGQPPIIGGPGLTQPQQHIQLTPASGITNGNGNGGGGGRNASNSGSLSGHGQSSGSSMRDIIGMDPNEIWKHFHQLEQRFTRMQDEYELRISRLQEDVISLKGQVANALNYNNDMPQRVPY